MYLILGRFTSLFLNCWYSSTFISYIVHSNYHFVTYSTVKPVSRWFQNCRYFNYYSVCTYSMLWSKLKHKHPLPKQALLPIQSTSQANPTLPPSSQSKQHKILKPHSTQQQSINKPITRAWVKPDQLYIPLPPSLLRSPHLCSESSGKLYSKKTRISSLEVQ